MTLLLVGHGRGRLLHKIIIKRKRELADESKSVSSLFMNHEKMMPNRCRGGSLTPKNPVISGFSGPLKLLPLGKFRYSRVYLSDFAGKTFAIMLIFHLLFGTPRFLSIKIVSQKTRVCKSSGLCKYLSKLASI